MLKRTNLKEVKETAIAFLYLDIEINEKIPIFLNHPFFDTVLFPLHSNGDAELDFVDITTPDNLQKARDEIKSKTIDRVKNSLQFLSIIRKPYLSAFFKYINIYLSERDYNNFLREMWISVEFLYNDQNVSRNEFIKYFKNANSSMLMEHEDLEIYKNLPDEIEIYRGVKPDSSPKALSWTLNKEVANWFAKRFEDNGVVYKAKIKKKDILAYFNQRNENEVVVDFKKLYDIEQTS